MAISRAVPLTLSEADRDTLEGWTRRGRTAQSLARRARIVLACAEPDATNVEVAGEIGVSRLTVASWRRRFSEGGPDGLLDEPRPGAPRKITDEQIERAVVTTLEATPPNATHWSTRSLARAVGLSQSAVVRIWHAFALQPHRSETFKLSRDPLFIDKVRDIVGLYMNPPDRALVLCVDEKPSIQALERTAPVLPMRPGQIERRTHDYVRHGTTDLFAALDIRTGKVIGATKGRHRAREFRDFLDLIEQNVPAALDVHLVLDNASIHKTSLIHDWLARKPRYHLHFTHLGLLAQHGRGLVRASEPPPAPARGLPSHRRSGGRDPSLHRGQQRRPTSLRLDQIRRCHPRQHQTVLSAKWCHQTVTGNF